MRKFIVGIECVCGNDSVELEDELDDECICTSCGAVYYYTPNTEDLIQAEWL